jgi:phage/plasmid-like protein (TIGR03299 family)
MNFLDSVFAATESRGSVVIVSAQHDVKQIRVEESAIQSAIAGAAGVSTWDAAEYGITAERAAQMIADADTPEARARVMGQLQDRAIVRAGLDTTGGRVAVMVAGQPAWHGLGVNVANAVGAADAIKLAGLNWDVKKIPLQFMNPVSGNLEAIEDKFAVVRMDSGAALGTVGRIYKPFQNAEGFEFLDSVIGEFGAHYETAGSIYGGSRVWMQLKIPAKAFALNGKDTVEPYVIFTNSHDGTAAAQCHTTSHRVVCANTLRLAGNASSEKFHIRHSTNLKAKVEAARQSLGLAVKKIDDFRTDAEAMARTKLDAVPYFNSVLDAVCEVTQADAEKGADFMASVLKATAAERDLERARVQREIDKRESLMEDILSRYDSEKNGIGGMRGTAWSAFNAVTESADHGKLGGRQTGAEKASRRFESVLTGAADEVKQVAYETVRAMAV